VSLIAASSSRCRCGLADVSAACVNPEALSNRLAARAQRVHRLRRKVSCVGDLFQADLSGGSTRYWRAFVTLTYRDGADWRPRHVSDFIRAMRRLLLKRGVVPRYLWVAELQRRGAIHYHFVFWLPVGVMLPKPDCGYWDHGWSRIEKVRNPGIGYLIKYLGKCSVHQPFPKGARTYGYGGLSLDSRDMASHHALPTYQRLKCEWYERVRRFGSGWISHVTGRCWPAFVPPYFWASNGVTVSC